MKNDENQFVSIETVLRS